MEKEEELQIRNAQRGNLAAFEKLVHLYDSRIMQLIFNMINDVEDTKDLYQEVFIKAFQSIKSFRFQSEFYTWLFRIAVNTCINFRKQKTSRQQEPLENYLAENNANWKIYIAAKDGNPEQQLIHKELCSQIRQSIDQLSAKQRSVFVLKHYHDYRLREIADIMNCSEGTVKNYMFRAVKKLRELLKVYQQT